MKKTYIVAVGLLFSVSANAQLLDVFKSAVKNQTGVDLSKIGQKKIQLPALPRHRRPLQTLAV